MTPLEKELENNHQAFRLDWTSQAEKNWAKLEGRPAFISSYRRLSGLNAIQHTLVIPNFSNASAAFFLEAQNDALVSHVNANVGGWRSALQALRSCIENVLNAVYYNQHPVELELWARGAFRITFSDLHKYMTHHPHISNLGQSLSGLDLMKTEYAVLSKAVHASAANFRMTDGASKVLLWSVDEARLGAWSTRERRVIDAICSLFVCLFASELQAAKNPQLRSVLSFAISAARQKQFKNVLKVNLT